MRNLKNAVRDHPVTALWAATFILLAVLFLSTTVLVQFVAGL